MEIDYKQVWDDFNHQAQPLFGIAHLSLLNGDIQKSKEYLEKFLKVWDETYLKLLIRNQY